MSIGAIDLFTQLAENDFGFFEKIQSTRDMMTPMPQTLGPNDSLNDAIELFRKGGFHHVPVVTPGSGEIVGIVSDRDVLRYYPYYLGTLSEGDDDHQALSTSVSRFMSEDVIHVHSGSSPVEALTFMLDNHVDSVVVFDDPKTIEGIITPRDFIRILLLYHQICTRNSELERLRIVDLEIRDRIPVDLIFSRGAQTARDVMSKNISSIDEAATIEDAIEAMQCHEVRHLPVANENGRLVGMLSDREILKWLAVPKFAASQVSPESFRGSLFETDDVSSLRGTVRDVMIKPPHTFSTGSLLVDLMIHFSEGTTSGVPIIDGGGQLCGILTTTDVLKVCRVVFHLSEARFEISG
ncbi:CBS domain-containing protein [Planctomycetota bacterium]